MSIRLCQACLHEVKEGDKLCSNCMVSVNRHATVIEVMSEYEGYSYVSNRYAFHDENLNNYNEDVLKDSKNSRLYPDNIVKNTVEEDEDFEYIEEEDNDFVKNIVKMINNPDEYRDVIWGLVGCLLLFLGNIYTIYTNFADIKRNNNIYLNFITVFIIATAFTAMLLVVKHKKKFVLIPTIITGMMLIFVMVDADNMKYLNVGYYTMWIALVLLVLSASMNTRSKLKKYFLRKKDLSWILMTFFISLGLVNTFNHYFGTDLAEATETKGQQITETIRFQNEEIKTIKVDEENVKIDMSLLDSYLVRNDDKDMVVVEISAFNKGKKAIKLTDYIDVFIVHNEKRVSFKNDMNDITYFQIADGSEKIAVDKCKTLFYAFELEDKGDSYLNIVNKEKNTSFISNQLIALNSKFYIEGKDIIPVGDGESLEKKEAKETYKIYFKKPASWSSKVYAYIYYIEDESVIEIAEWPGEKMNKKDDMYELTYDKKWYKKAKVIIIDKQNQNNVFPKKGSLGLKLEGNINIMPNE